MGKPLALIVDDEKSICETLSGVLQDEGWDCISANSGEEGIRKLQDHDVSLVLLDVWMAELDGIETLQLMKNQRPFLPIVIMSGHGNIETAVKATKLGAFDFLEKPLSLEKLIPLIEHAEKHRHKEEQQQKVDIRSSTYQLIGNSEVISRIHRQIRVIAPRNSWVLVTGENGTGKEVVARNIHLQSSRADKPFVAMNCAAIPEELIESELFGHSKGAFTNAHASKVGKFELAHQGTLFLDEIGDMSLRTQAKILRVLQEQMFERVGGNETISVDVRVIAATNKDLQKEIKSGHFREDLFYRLNVIPIHLKPLRERTEDILPLVDYFLQKMAIELGEHKKEVTEEAKVALINYKWPGNIRELKNLIERLSILVERDWIDFSDFSDCFYDGENVMSRSELNPPSQNLKEARIDFERTFILKKLKENDWNVSKTAETIGVERSNLHRKLRSYEIDLKQLK